MTKDKPIRVSAKALGELALPNFCPKCFQLKKTAKTLPFQSFPSIFNDLDGCTKKFVHGWFDKYKCLPTWLNELGPITGYIEPPSWRELFVEMDGIILSGSPDGVFIQDELLVVDYKTAKFTGHQDELFPIYEVQLNAYAYLLEKCGKGKVGNMALIYMEPNQDVIDSMRGFRVELTAHVLKVERKIGLVEELVKKASEIVYAAKVIGREKCKECRAVEKIGKN